MRDGHCPVGNCDTTPAELRTLLDTYTGPQQWRVRALANDLRFVRIDKPGDDQPSEPEQDDQDDQDDDDPALDHLSRLSPAPTEADRPFEVGDHVYFSGDMTTPPSHGTVLNVYTEANVVTGINVYWDLDNSRQDDYESELPVFVNVERFADRRSVRVMWRAGECPDEDKFPRAAADRQEAEEVVASVNEGNEGT
jgi:hypothetical protein